MKDAITVLQVVLGIVLIGLILLQAKGTGLGRNFSSMAYHSKRGVETLIFRITIVLAVLFVGLSMSVHLLV